MNLDLHVLTSFTFCLSLSFAWWFIGGGLFCFFNAVSHSETNCILTNLKYDKKKSGKKIKKFEVLYLRSLQVLHCLGYCVFPFGFYVIWHWIYV